MILVIKENIAKVANIFVQNVGLLVASSKIPPKLELRMYKKMLLNLMKTVHTGSNIFVIHKKNLFVLFGKENLISKVYGRVQLIVIRVNLSVFS